MKTKFILLFLLSIFLTVGKIYAQASMGFMIRNESINNGKFEFDVFASASALGTFHSRGQVYINYSETFGDSAVNKGRASFQQLALLNETLPMFGNKYATIGFADNAGGRIALTWQTNFPAAAPSSLAHTEVPEASTPLYHITFDIIDSNVPISISFEQNLMNGQQFQIIAPILEVAYSDWVFPIELLDFQATPLTAEAVRLDWLTAKELNNDYFVIEKKLAGKNEYIVIAEVNGAGTTDEIQEYSFLDETEMSAVNYYRLKQVDFDGTSTYSKMIEVRVNISESPVYTVYPNPATDFVNLKALGQLEYDRTYELINLQGTVLHAGKLAGSATYQVETFPLGDLPAGMYFVRVQGELNSHAFIKK